MDEFTQAPQIASPFSLAHKASPNIWDPQDPKQRR